MKRSLSSIAAALLVVLVALANHPSTSQGRGFGGGRGGGLGGGGLGGGLGGGGFGGGLGGGGLGGGLGGGGLGGPGLGDRGFAGAGLGGGLGAGGFGGAGLGGAGLGGGGLGAGGLGGAGFGGDGALGRLGGTGGPSLASAGPLLAGQGTGGVGGLDRPGAGGGGFGFGQAGGALGGGLGAGGFGAGGLGNAIPNRSQLGSFLGLPSDEGVHAGAIAGGAGNFGIGGDRPAFGDGSLAGISGQRGAGGNLSGVGDPTRPNLSGVGDPTRPNLSGVGDPTRASIARGSFTSVRASTRYVTATSVRTNFNHWGVYGHDWYARYPHAWFAAGWAAGAVWRPCTWNTAAVYCGCYESAPVYYNYGNNVTYQDNSVYINGANVGTAQDYYTQADSLASAGAAANAPADGDWLPLGVFALTKPDQKTSDVSIQLAVDRQGVIRGNYTDSANNTNQLVQGSVDKQTQRVAFTVGDDTKDVVETGVYNLTKDEAPCLIHFGPDRTEQWLLVRLKQPETTAAAQ